MKKAPGEYHANEIIDRESWGTFAQVDGRWVPARPLNLPGFKRRFVLAWDVLTGRADALYWEGQ